MHCYTLSYKMLINSCRQLLPQDLFVKLVRGCLRVNFVLLENQYALPYFLEIYACLYTQIWFFKLFLMGPAQDVMLITSSHLCPVISRAELCHNSPSPVGLVTGKSPSQILIYCFHSCTKLCYLEQVLPSLQHLTKALLPQSLIMCQNSVGWSVGVQIKIVR